MNEMLAAARGLKAADNIRQDSSELMADVSKLVHIIDMLIDITGDYVIEVHVSPMTIVQMLMRQVKSLQFFIKYDAAYGSEDAKKSADEVLMELVKSEFTGIESYEPTVFSMYDDWDVPTFLLYSKDGVQTVDELDDSTILFLHSFLSCTGAGGVSIPATYPFSKRVNMFVHCESLVSLDNLKRKVSEFGQMVGREFKEVTVFGYESVEFNIVYMIGLKPLQYEVPYLYIDNASIGEQRISDLLKGYEDQ